MNTTPTKLVEGLFEEYVTRLYPATIHPEQRKELRMTFFAGAFVIIEAINNATKPGVPEAESAAIMQGIESEVLHACEAIATQQGARN